MKEANGLSFGRYGTVQSSGILSAASGVSGSVEVWVQPDHWSSSSTILAFYEPESRRLFALHQSVSDLELETKFQNNENQTTNALFCVADAFLLSLQRKKPIFVTVIYGPDGTKIYLDGKLAEAESSFEVPRDAFRGRIVVGDSPRQPDSFRGQIRGLAIYDAELTTPQVSRHYLTWTKNGHPDIAESDNNIALYLLDEKAGTVIHNPPGGSCRPPYSGNIHRR